MRSERKSIRSETCGTGLVVGRLGQQCGRTRLSAADGAYTSDGDALGWRGRMDWSFVAAREALA